MPDQQHRRLNLPLHLLLRKAPLMSEELPRPRGRNGGRKRKLTAEQAAEARRLWDARAMTLKALGARFDVAPSTVHGYVKTPRRREK